MADWSAFIDWLKTPAVWLSSASNRQRLKGARVEVVILVLTRQPEASILMVLSQFGNCWMPPQEGVDLHEKLADAMVRGLREECGVEIADARGRYHRKFYIRDVRYLGTLDLPPERWEERSIAGNVGDSMFSHIKMRKKAYWSASITIPSRQAINPVPNISEVQELRWMTLDEARTAIQSNRPEKADLLEGALRRGVQHLLGAEAAASW